jgi:hypothetical protein
MEEIAKEAGNLGVQDFFLATDFGACTCPIQKFALF